MDKEINFLLNIKLYSFKRVGLNFLTVRHLKEVLYNSIWKNGVPTRLSDIASDIEKLTVNEVAEYLSDNVSFEETDTELLEENID